MMRTQLIKLAAAPTRRYFSVAAVRAAEGDINSLSSGGSARGDSFNKREQASENMFIREREKEA